MIKDKRTEKIKSYAVRETPHMRCDDAPKCPKCRVRHHLWGFPNMHAYYAYAMHNRESHQNN